VPLARRCLSSFAPPVLKPGHELEDHMLKASDLRATHGDATIFDALSLTLSGARRSGLVGPNGAGKTTLLRLLAGVSVPERGTVSVGPGDRVGYLPQEPPGPDLTIDRLLGAALGEVWRLHGELERLEQRLGEPELLVRYGEVQERFGALGGWALQAQLDGARDALGIAHIPLDAPLGGLSGGEAARALLAGVLLARPTVLLLDEPTNHLDLDGLQWLEEFLAGFAGTVLVVSHDRRFLDDTVSQILELDGGTLTAYSGSYTAYREEKTRAKDRVALAYEAQQKRHRRLEADIAATRGFAVHTETTVSRAEAPKMKRYAKKVAKKAQSRERRLRRELDSDEHIEKPRHVGALKVELAGSAGGRLVAALRDVTAGWDGEPLLHGVDLPIHGRDRIAITGPNGAGKSTLLALLQGELEPLSGTVERPVKAAVLPQGTDALPADVPAVAFVRSHAAAGEGEARRLLGHFGLEGAAALRPLGRLSPGERARTAIAAMVAAKAELLLLDEPTNHLDFPSLDVLEAALREYPGAIVAVSHDRAFLDAIGSERRLEVRDGEVREM
jgi:ATPase subunit of ABC transporter with duplicated ATPase domains